MHFLSSRRTVTSGRFSNNSSSSSFSHLVPPFALLNFSLMSFFRKDDDETPEDKLITTIKRAILSIQVGAL